MKYTGKYDNSVLRQIDEKLRGKCPKDCSRCDRYTDKRCGKVESVAVSSSARVWRKTPDERCSHE